MRIEPRISLVNLPLENRQGLSLQSQVEPEAAFPNWESSVVLAPIPRQGAQTALDSPREPGEQSGKASECPVGQGGPVSKKVVSSPLNQSVDFQQGLAGASLLGHPDFDFAKAGTDLATPQAGIFSSPCQALLMSGKPEVVVDFVANVIQSDQAKPWLQDKLNNFLGSTPKAQAWETLQAQVRLVQSATDDRPPLADVKALCDLQTEGGAHLAAWVLEHGGQGTPLECEDACRLLLERAEGREPGEKTRFLREGTAALGVFGNWWTEERTLVADSHLPPGAAISMIAARELLEPGKNLDLHLLKAFMVLNPSQEVQAAISLEKAWDPPQDFPRVAKALDVALARHQESHTKEEQARTLQRLKGAVQTAMMLRATGDRHEVARLLTKAVESGAPFVPGTHGLDDELYFGARHALQVVFGEEGPGSPDPAQTPRDGVGGSTPVAA